jgi:peptidoglycan L-alanyl-D-glutamate endopeptidase CwlK
MPMDNRSTTSVASLLPAVQERFRAFYDLANVAAKSKGLEVRFISGTRTYAEQDALYKRPCDHIDNDGDGKIDEADEKVTNAPAGYSNHNFGIAVDVGIFKNGKYQAESPFYAEIGPIGEAAGLKWGGRWKTPDRPHYEYPTGLTLAQMRARVAANKPVVA